MSVDCVPGGFTIHPAVMDEISNEEDGVWVVLLDSIQVPFPLYYITNDEQPCRILTGRRIAHACGLASSYKVR